MRNICIQFSLKIFTIGFFIGVCLPQFYPKSINFYFLPVIFLLIFLVITFFTLCVFINNEFKQLVRILPDLTVNLIGICLGFVWMWININSFKKNSELYDILDDKIIAIIAQVLDVKNIMKPDFNLINKYQLDLKIKQVLIDPKLTIKLVNFKCLENNKFRVEWIAPKNLIIPGDYWQLFIRLKKPHNFATKGSFDVEKYFFAKRIKMLGKVVSKNNNILISRNYYSCVISKIRWYLISYFNLLMNDWDLKKKVFYSIYH